MFFIISTSSTSLYQFNTGYNKLRQGHTVGSTYGSKHTLIGILKSKRHLEHRTSASSALTTESTTMCPLKSSEQSNEDNKQRYSETKRGEIKAHLFPGRIVRNGRGQRQKRNVPRAQTMETQPLLLL
ncbi:unnamed protein product [Colias eurytheme]|nr:unnamed protein product [Colias eurytheme]